MIRTFGRCVIVALVMALLIPVVIFGVASIFVCEFISRIVYAESVLDEQDIEEVIEAFCIMLKEMKSYIIG